MALRILGPALLILLPLAAIGLRLHSHSFRTPTDVTRELNRCLSVVRVAAFRRGGASQGRTVPGRRTTAGGRPGDW